MSESLRQHVKRGIYACGAARRLSYKIWPPVNTQTELALAECGSVIHVGANEGQERYIYEFLQLEVLWVEPIPAVFSKLLRNIHGVRKQRATQALLGNSADQIRTLHISNNGGLSSSIFDLADHREIWPDVHYIDRIECVTATLDSLLPLLPSAGALVLDTQGAELMVLTGGEQTLRQVRTVKAEAASFQSYKDACTDTELIDFLTPRGFTLAERRRFADHPAGGAYYDLVFRKAP